jgi:hypothetical protein
VARQPAATSAVVRAAFMRGTVPVARRCGPGWKNGRSTPGMASCGQGLGREDDISRPRTEAAA